MQSHENLSSVEFSDASNFAKLPVSSKALYDAVTEVSHNASGLPQSQSTRNLGNKSCELCTKKAKFSVVFGRNGHCV